MKEVAEKSSTDSFLFGDNFAEKIKSAKALEKAGKELLCNTSNKGNSRKLPVGGKGGGDRSDGVARRYAQKPASD